MYVEKEFRPYTIEELDARIDQAEGESVAESGVDTEEMLRELDKEFYTPEEAYELVMSDIKPIYGIRDAV